MVVAAVVDLAEGEAAVDSEVVEAVEDSAVDAVEAAIVEGKIFCKVLMIV